MSMSLPDVWQVHGDRVAIVKQRRLDNLSVHNLQLCWLATWGLACWCLGSLALLVVWLQASCCQPVHCCTSCTYVDCRMQEQYEEIVFVNPNQAFYQRMIQHQPRSRMPLSIEAYLHPPNEQEELAVIQEARREVAQISAGLRVQLQQPMVDSPSGMGMHM